MTLPSSPQHLAVDRHRQSAHGEAGVHGDAERQVERRPWSVVLCGNVVRLLVEIGILTTRRVLVVAVERGGQVAIGNPQCRFHFGDRLPAVDELDQRHLGHLHVRLVDDQVRGLIRLFQHERRRA